MTLRAALLRVFDLAEDRPDIRAVVTGALAAAKAPTEGLPDPEEAGRVARLRAFLEDEDNHVGGVWGDYGQIVVDASMVWDIIDGRPHKWEMSAEYAATLNQAKEALAACEERAAAEAAPEIDVKRLARALATPWPDSFSPFGYSDPLWRRALAEALAAAYRADPLDERTS
jgi:hypothetical protein